MQKFLDNLVLLFEQPEEGPLWQQRIDRIFYILILLSSLGVILETLDFVKERPLFLEFLHGFEDVAMAIFAVELLLRFLVIGRLYANCQDGWERFLLFFYTLIDILAVLPAIISAVLYVHHDYFLTFRLLRVFKTFRHDDSVEIVLRAILIKKDILFKTAIIVVITTIFLAVMLYEAENKFELSDTPASPVEQVDASSSNLSTLDKPGGKEVQDSTKFKSIGISIAWCFSMFVGDLAGFKERDFIPVTHFGQFIAGILGFLNIAIVVIPTGIIASGFLEVLEEKTIESQYKVLRNAFRPKYNPTLKISLYERPRTVFTLQNALFIHQNTLFRILETKPGFRLRAVHSDNNEKYSDINLVEYYGYGTLTLYGVKRIVKDAQATVICPDGFVQKGVGYFAYAISEIFRCNLISNERFLKNSLDMQFDASFLHNPDYQSREVLPRSKRKLKEVPMTRRALFQFRNHIRGQARKQPMLIFVSDEMVKNFEILPLDAALSLQNDLFTWLRKQQLSTYVILVSQSRLENYLYFDLIAEVAEAIKKENILNINQI